MTALTLEKTLGQPHPPQPANGCQNVAPAEDISLCMSSAGIGGTWGTSAVKKSNSKSLGSKDNLTILMLLSDSVYLKERKANTQRSLVSSVAVWRSCCAAEEGDNTGDNPVR